MTVYVLTLDGYVHGVFKNLSRADKALQSISPQSLIWGVDNRPRSYSLWNMRWVFRETDVDYVSVVCPEGHMYELSMRRVV